MNHPSERDGDTDAGAQAGIDAQLGRRQRMLDAAVELASSGGFDAVQMRAVAERADVALGTLYRYFPSKVHLLVSALGSELERAALAQDRRVLPGATPYDRVMDVLGRYTRLLQRDPLLTEAMTRAYVFADASAAPAVRVVERQVARLLTGAMQSPAQVPPQDPAQVPPQDPAPGTAQDPGQDGQDTAQDPGQDTAQDPGQGPPDGPGSTTERDLAVAKVIGDVWLACLVQWVTGRARAEEVSRSMELAVRLLLRP